MPSIPGVTLIKEIARGGMGVVYRGRQDYLEREVAVKILAQTLQGGTFAQRFQREAKILAGINHPNIVACHFAGATDDGMCYLVMEFVDGPTLKDWIDTYGAMEPASALRLGRAMAGALKHAHELNVIHRDVKAENILLESITSTTLDPRFPYSPKLVDLGIARMHTESGSHEIGLTSPGSVVGTPSCMSPEQFDMPETVDFRADIYGLGCVLYRALTGVMAFEGNKLTSLVAQKRERLGPNPCGRRAEIPAPVGALVSQLMAADRNERPKSYDELIARIDELLATDLRPRPAAPTQPAAGAASDSGSGGLLATAEFSFLAEGGLVSPHAEGAVQFRGTQETPLPAGAQGALPGTAVGAGTEQLRQPSSGGPKLGVIAGFVAVAAVAVGVVWFTTRDDKPADPGGAQKVAGAGGAKAGDPQAGAPQNGDPKVDPSVPDETDPQDGGGTKGPDPDPVPGPNRLPEYDIEVPARLTKNVPVECRAVGADPDGDDVVYTWSYQGLGTVEFDPPTGATTNAILRHGLDGEKLTIRVAASDGRGAAVVREDKFVVDNRVPTNLLEFMKRQLAGEPLEQWRIDTPEAWSWNLQEGYINAWTEEGPQSASLALDGPVWRLAGILESARQNSETVFAEVGVRIEFAERALAIVVRRSEYQGAKWTVRVCNATPVGAGWDYSALVRPGSGLDEGSQMSWQDPDEEGIFAVFDLSRRGDTLELRYGREGAMRREVGSCEDFGDGQPRLVLFSDKARGTFRALNLY